MSASTLGLELLCSLGGLVMIAGGLTLLFKRKVLVDAQSKDVVEYELPLVGRLKTNSPAIAVFALGLLALGFPLWLQRNATAEVTMSGTVQSSSNAPVHVYAVTDEANLETGAGTFHLDVPLVGKTYDVLYLAAVGNSLSVLDKKPVSVSSATNPIELGSVVVSNLPGAVRYKTSGR